MPDLGKWIEANESNVPASIRFAYHKSNPEVQFSGWAYYDKRGAWISPRNSIYGENTVSRIGGSVIASFHHSGGDLSYQLVFKSTSFIIQVEEKNNRIKSVFTGRCIPKVWM